MEFEKNEDGTDKLDEQGNPIPKITNNGNEDDKKVIANLVEEIKDLRLQNGIVTDLLKKLDTKPTEPKPAETEEDKITIAVEKILKAKESSDAQANKIAAFEKYCKENKEFHPENDSLGLKRNALKAKFEQFNSDGLTTTEQFYSLIGDAKTLLMNNDTTSSIFKGDKIPSPMPPTPRPSPNDRPTSELTPREIKLMESTGRTKEQMLKIKSKHPDLLEQLLEHIRD